MPAALATHPGSDERLDACLGYVRSWIGSGLCKRDFGEFEKYEEAREVEAEALFKDADGMEVGRRRSTSPYQYAYPLSDARYAQASAEWRRCMLGPGASHCMRKACVARANKVVIGVDDVESAVNIGAKELYYPDRADCTADPIRAECGHCVCQNSCLLRDPDHKYCDVGLTLKPDGSPLPYAIEYLLTSENSVCVKESGCAFSKRTPTPCQPPQTCRDGVGCTYGVDHELAGDPVDARSARVAIDDERTVTRAQWEAFAVGSARGFFHTHVLKRVEDLRAYAVNLKYAHDRSGEVRAPGHVAREPWCLR